MSEQPYEQGPLEYRSVKDYGVNFPQRMIELIVMPYEEETIADYHGRPIREIISRGAFDGIDNRPGRVRVNRDHDVTRTCGKAISFHPSRQEGLVAELLIAGTTLGEETLELADKGMLDASAGFRPLLDKRSRKPMEEWPTRDFRRVNKAWLGHIAMVSDPAYDGARVLAVRSERTVATAALTGRDTPNLDRARALRLTEMYDLISH